jgi:hypothetical protein
VLRPDQSGCKSACCPPHFVHLSRGFTARRFVVSLAPCASSSSNVSAPWWQQNGVRHYAAMRSIPWLGGERRGIEARSEAAIPQISFRRAGGSEPRRLPQLAARAGGAGPALLPFINRESAVVALGLTPGLTPRQWRGHGDSISFRRIGIAETEEQPRSAKSGLFFAGADDVR